VHLARLDGDVDVIVGHQVAEALGDAAQFESQRNLLKAGAGGANARTVTSLKAEPPPGREEIIPGAARRSANQCLAGGHFGALADSTLTVPAMMSALSLSTSPLRPASILLSNLLYGASETPSFSSVPR
jgi:hypothetical protein